MCVTLSDHKFPKLNSINQLIISCCTLVFEWYILPLPPPSPNPVNLREFLAQSECSKNIC